MHGPSARRRSTHLGSPGGRRKGRSGGGEEDRGRGRGRKSTRSTSCPAGHVSHVGLSPFIPDQSPSTERQRETAAVFFFLRHRVSPFLSLPFLSQRLLLKLEPKQERKCGFSLGPTGLWDHKAPARSYCLLPPSPRHPTLRPNPKSQASAPFVFLGLSKQRWEPVRPGLTEATAEDKHFTSRILLLYKEPGL